MSSKSICPQFWVLLTIKISVMIEESIIPQIEGFELISANYEENPDFHDALLVDFRVMNSQDRCLSVEMSLNTFWYDFDKEYEPGESLAHLGDVIVTFLLEDVRSIVFDNESGLDFTTGVNIRRADYYDKSRDYFELSADDLGLQIIAGKIGVKSVKPAPEDLFDF